MKSCLHREHFWHTSLYFFLSLFWPGPEQGHWEVSATVWLIQLISCTPVFLQALNKVRAAHASILVLQLVGVNTNFGPQLRNADAN